MGYISKEEIKVPINDPSGKWTDLTLLPEWEEEIYDVYTVRKHGKWVMLKTLKEKFRNDPEYREILEREFDTRYNLAHANIVMVNDLEDVPGLGLSIITDDAYGYSLRRLIDEKRLTPKIVRRLESQLLDAMEYLQENHIAHSPITPDNIIFTEYTENLKLLNVGFDHKETLTPQDARQDIISYGKIINEVLDHLPESLPKLRKVARKCEDPEGPYRTVADVALSLNRQHPDTLLFALIFFIIIMLAVIIWLLLR